MKKNSFFFGILVMVLVFGTTGTTAFAQEKHNPFDILVGVNVGFGISPNTFGLLGSLSNTSNFNTNALLGNYAVTGDFGATGDFYLFNWLSVSTGFMLHPDLYVLLDQDLSWIFEDVVKNNSFSGFSKIAATPLCLTIPITAHVNIPRVEWLYAGAGLSLNIPLFGMMDSTLKDLTGFDIDTKGKFFIGLPVDIGFDFIKPGRGGMRLFFRITPEFHDGGVTVPIGLVWQAWNWKVFSR